MTAGFALLLPDGARTNIFTGGSTHVEKMIKAAFKDFYGAK